MCESLKLKQNSLSSLQVQGYKVETLGSISMLKTPSLGPSTQGLIPRLEAAIHLMEA